MNNNILIIDSNMDEAKDFVRGLKKATNEDWIVELYENNKIYGIRRYLKFFTVGWKVFKSKKKYKDDVILCWQQFYGIVIAFFLRIFNSEKYFNLVIMTFIFKHKKGFVGTLFYKFVKYAVSSKYIDKIICTSKNEMEYYSELFDINKDIFEFVKWGAVDYSEDIKFDDRLLRKKYYFSTGRSNRDYNFLINAFKKTKLNLVIACDDLNESTCSNIEIHNDLFDKRMLRYMKNSIAVVIALENETIASGQLVLLHAMNLGVPVIITKSHGVTDDYVIDEYNGLIIDKTEKSLFRAINKLDNKEFYDFISKNGITEFHQNYTKYSLGINIGNVIAKLK